MHYSQRVRHCKKSGVSMTEYGLCAGVCLLVALPALSNLAGGLDNRFSHMLGSTSSLKVSSPVVAASQKNDTSSSAANQTLSFDVDGKRIVLPNVPTDTAASIQTVGTNGKTHLLSEQLILLAKQLLAAGKVTPEQADDLILLANRGHSLADLQGSVETTLAQLQKDGNVANHPVTLVTRHFKGPKDQTGTAFTRTYTNVYSAAANMDVEVDKQASSWLLEFQKAWDVVKTSGVLTNANVEATVNHLAGRIYTLAADFSSSVAKAPQKASNISDVVMKSVVEKQIHGHATGICDVAQGKDTGIRCMDNRS
jgi:Flp pilus assembly pilin Flp